MTSLNAASRPPSVPLVNRHQHPTAGASAWGLMLGLAIVLVAAIVGLAVALRLWVPAMLIAALVIYLPVFWMFAHRRQARSELLWIFLLLLVGLPFFRKFTGIDLFLLIELSLLAAAPVALLRYSELWRNPTGWRAFTLVFGLFLLVAVLSTLFGRSRGVPAVYQLLTNMKLLFMLLVGYCIAFDKRSEGWFWGLVAWFWLPNALLVAWQWADLSSYLSFFSGSSTGGGDPLGLLPSRAMGMAHHPTVFGALVGFFFVCAAARWAVTAQWRYAALAWVYFLLIFASGQRQELLAALLVTALMLGLARGWRHLLVIAVPAVVLLGLALLAVWPIIEPSLDRELRSWGATAYGRFDQPRQVLYVNSFDLANRYFPLGSGLGTFAGAGSVKFDMSLYWQLGFGSFSWIDRKEYLMDTYWPNFIAETGWLGLMLMGLSIIAVVAIAARNWAAASQPSARVLALIGLGGVLFVAGLTPTSPAFQDPSLFLLPALFVGIAYNRIASLQPSPLPDAGHNAMGRAIRRA